MSQSAGIPIWGSRDQPKSSHSLKEPSLGPTVVSPSESVDIPTCRGLRSWPLICEVRLTKFREVVS